MPNWVELKIDKSRRRFDPAKKAYSLAAWDQACVSKIGGLKVIQLNCFNNVLLLKMVVETVECTRKNYSSDS